jgi:hypothetical protein
MNNKSKPKKVRQSKQMLQIHGKDESNVPSRAPLTLDEIMGESLSIYTAQSSDEYRAQLTEMNMTDLQAHAYKVGLVPTQDRKVLNDRLVQEFVKWNSRYNASAVTSSGITSMEDLDAKAKKILREGA